MRSTRQIIFVLNLFVTLQLFGQITVITPLCENKLNPTGVSLRNLNFSWEMESGATDVVQSAYQLVISSSPKLLDKGRHDVYNSGTIRSSQSIQNIYGGKDLKPGTIYYWRVRVWDGQNNASRWSKTQSFITGIFRPEDWRHAQWIALERSEDSMRVVPFVHGRMKAGNPKMVANTQSPLLRKQFVARGAIKHALLFISGLGHYEASINGRIVGDAFIAPGWTNYDKSILYNTYDVTKFLNPGPNTLGVILGNGFYNISQERYVKGTGSYGKPKLKAMLKIIYSDNAEQYVVSDGSWKTAASPITFNNIYGGEDFDAQLRQDGWDNNHFDDKNWKRVVIVPSVSAELLPEMDYPVRIMDTLSIRNKFIKGDGSIIYDFGQNVSGIPLIRIQGQAGQKVKLIPAELLDDSGRILQAEGVSPHYYNYTCKGLKQETWHPKFTYFAVRYIQVEGAAPVDRSTADLPVIRDIKLLHNRNSTPSNGSFVCSNETFNQVYRLIDWAIRSNLQSYITDNPQREKLSWQGEQNFMRESINYSYDVYNLYRSLIRNNADAQHESGLVPDIAPEYMQFSGPFVDSPEWGTTAILNLWFLYKYYGDSATMRAAYNVMTRYASHLKSRSTDNLLMYGLGDWLEIGNVTPKGLTATAYYYHAIDRLSEMAELLGKKDDAEYYRALADQIKLAFNSKFFNQSTQLYGTGSQTSMAMPLNLGLVEEKFKLQVLQKLADRIRKVDSLKLTAGDVGHRHLVNVLAENGYSDILYEITMRDDVPGYRYQLKLGATALAETWDGKLSQNQLAMGHLTEWLFGTILGISQQPESIAFKKIRIRPQPVGDLTSASGKFHSPYGWIHSEWTKTENTFTLKIKIPVNTTAKVYLPVSKSSKVYKQGILISSYHVEHNSAIVEVGSGAYEFRVE